MDTRCISGEEPITQVQCQVEGQEDKEAIVTRYMEEMKQREPKQHVQDACEV